MQISLIVNAGGRSRRMGREKALLSVPGTGQALLAHTIERLAPLVNGEIVVVSSQLDLLQRAGIEGGVRRVDDAFPNGGALGGLASGLRQISGWVMCVACDMPFVNPALMRLLIEQAATDDAPVVTCADVPSVDVPSVDVPTDAQFIDGVVPRVAGRLEPFHALYHRRVTGCLARALEKGNLRIGDALAGAQLITVDEARLRRVDPELRAFWNVNTPEDWAQACVWLAEEFSGKGR